MTTALAQDAIPLSMGAPAENAALKSVMYDSKIAIAQSAFYVYVSADAGEPAKMMHVGQSDNGREVTLAMGQILELSLAENPTTGFHWDLKSKAGPACELVDSTFVPPEGGRLGAGGIHRWQFRAVHSGSGEVELEYRRSAEDAAPAKVYKLGVRVID
jgi:predicted secreted protein